ncbi:magnesium transporter [Candidatus Riesia pediculicola USDA]|uniref:Magnesium transporter n=1 Tax=Riesia pediculicola (strain USDA) TaxID=515618 RepID=D4G7V2_RIEPU|nr:magnesium transporter [Candidatus Riesia pediculicola USDA]ARC53669.1 hypothetical protein AOE55_00660 [Candidatus Riesia pediculicola]ARC54130.1 hypothetical protein AOE57_00655 [Candidatus Riesia pediculicola]ARC54521.1 hypothetical protein AOE56_00710 [Candidatus Riesia pediculicola]
MEKIIKREKYNQAKLNHVEDIFSSSIWRSVRNRWIWPTINLCTAFIASRVIEVFENTISHIVTLATLMPIVACVGGNTGNQTTAIIIRAIALHQVKKNNISFLFLRELGVALINGIFCGSIAGIIIYFLYHSIKMSFIMTLAMILNLMTAALIGVAIPLIMIKSGKDPAIGSSVIITAITDTSGFFIFLWLATLFLI